MRLAAPPCDGARRGDEVKWGSGAAFSPAGAQAAILLGNPAQEGPFVLRLKFARRIHRTAPPAFEGRAGHGDRGPVRGPPRERSWIARQLRHCRRRASCISQPAWRITLGQTARPLYRSMAWDRSM